MVVCPRCQVQVNLGAFCSNCGLPLGSVTIAARFGPDGVPLPNSQQPNNQQPNNQQPNNPQPDNTLLLTNPDRGHGVSAVEHTSLIKQPSTQQPPTQQSPTQQPPAQQPSAQQLTQQPPASEKSARSPWVLVTAAVLAVAIIAAAIVIILNTMNGTTTDATEPEVQPSQSMSAEPAATSGEPSESQPSQTQLTSTAVTPADSDFERQFPDAPPPVVTQTELLTVTAPASTDVAGVSVAATTVTVVSPANPTAATSLAAGCSGEYLVILGSAGTAAGGERIVAAVSADLPGATLLLGTNGCYPFTNPNGAAAAIGPYPTLEQACQARFGAPRGSKYVDAYVKRSDPSGPTSYSCICPFPTSSLPVLAMDPAVGTNSGPYVAELQGALDDLQLYPREVNDGNFEGVTDTAVRNAQILFGLPVDGVVNTAFWDALHAKTCG